MVIRYAISSDIVLGAYGQIMGPLINVDNNHAFFTIHPWILY